MVQQSDDSISLSNVEIICRPPLQVHGVFGCGEEDDATAIGFEADDFIFFRSFVTFGPEVRVI